MGLPRDDGASDSPGRLAWGGALGALVVCCPLDTQQEALFLAPKALAFGVVTAALLWRARARLSLGGWDRFDAALALAGVCAGLSTALAAAVRPTLPSLALELTFLLACVALRRFELRETTDRIALLGTCAVAAVALAEACGLEILANVPRRPLGLLGNRNAVAGFLALCLPLLFDAARRRSPRVLGVVVFLSATVIATTRCRGAWLATVAVTLVCALAALRWSGPERRAGAILLACAVAGGLCGMLVPWPGLHWNDDGALSSASHVLDMSSGSGRGRLEELSLGLLAWREHPWLGVGPGGWASAAAAHAHAIEAHHAARLLEPVAPSSDVVRLLAEHGLAGVLAVLGLVVLTMRGLARTADMRRATTLAATLTAGAVLATTDTPFLRGDVMILLACVVAEATPRRPTALDARRVPGAAPLAPVLALLAISTFAVALSAARVAASHLSHSSDAAMRRLADDIAPSARARLAILEVARSPSERRDAGVALLEHAPGSWGVMLITAGALNATGDVPAARAMFARLDAAEPHWRDLEAARRRADGRPTRRGSPAPHAPATRSPQGR